MTEGGGLRHIDRTGEDTKATEAFGKLAEKVGAKVRSSKDGKVQVIDLPGGGTASVRPTSKTGPPTIQINRPDGSTEKIRFKEY